MTATLATCRIRPRKPLQNCLACRLQTRPLPSEVAITICQYEGTTAVSSRPCLQAFCKVFEKARPPAIACRFCGTLLPESVFLCADLRSLPRPPGRFSMLSMPSTRASGCPQRGSGGLAEGEVAPREREGRRQGNIFINVFPKKGALLWYRLLQRINSN